MNPAQRLRPVAAPLRSAREENIYTLKPKARMTRPSPPTISRTAPLSSSTWRMWIALTRFASLISWAASLRPGRAGPRHESWANHLPQPPPEFDISSDETNFGENPDFFFRDMTPRPVTPGVPTPSAPAASGAPPMSAASHERDASSNAALNFLPNRRAPLLGTVNQGKGERVKARRGVKVRCFCLYLFLCLSPHI